ncbi:MAG TPA: hypothetical protein VJ617_10710 [Arthrobacter sp.]|nr:hypothetical protein [Arthrobacter sp.]
MKRTFATLGVMGLGLISLTAPAMAAPNMVIVCHDGGATGTTWQPLQFNVNGLSGHDEHPTDIIPPNESIPAGLNWTNAGKILYIDNCAPLPAGETPPVYPPVVVPPVVVPPIEVPPVVETPVVETPVLETPVVETPVVETPVVATPVVEAPVVQTPVTTVTPTVQTPAAPAATVQTPALTGAAAVSQGTNQGFNAQTAVGGTESAPTWLAGLGVMLGAGALVAVRRRSLEPKAD